MEENNYKVSNLIKEMGKVIKFVKDRLFIFYSSSNMDNFFKSGSPEFGTAFPDLSRFPGSVATTVQKKVVKSVLAFFYLFYSSSSMDNF